MSVSIAPSPFGSLSVSVAETGSTLDVSVLSTSNCVLTMELGVPGPQGEPGQDGAPGVGVPSGGSAGQVLAKVDGVDYNTEWVNVQGDYLPLAGGTMDANALVNFSDGSNDSQIGGWGFGVEVSGNPWQYATVEPQAFTTSDGTNVMAVTPNGITFPNSTSQNTAFDPSLITYSVYDNQYAISTDSIILSKDTSNGGTQVGMQESAELNKTFLISKSQNWVDDGEGGVSPVNGLGYRLDGFGYYFINYDGSIPSGTIRYYRNQIQFSDNSTQTIAFPGFDNAALTGNPTAPTPATSDNDTSIATTAFVKAQGYLTTSSSGAVPSGGTTGQVLTKTSSTSYALSWSTPSVGDKYYSTSTTSLSVSNGTKTLTIATGLSYTTQQSVIVAYDASNHMHGTVTSYNSSTGVIVVDVTQHTGTGTYSLWTVNVGGISSTAEWGLITGTLSAQTDLQAALDAKLAVTTAASTYQTQAGMSAYLTTSTAASTYAPLASPTFTGTPSLPTGTTAVTQSVGNNTTAVATTAFVLANAGSPTYATISQTLTATSTTVAMNPLTDYIGGLNPAVYAPSVAQLSLTSTGTGAGSTANANGYTVTLGSTSGAYTTRNQTLWPNRVAVTGNIQWTRPVGFSARVAVYNRMDVNAQFGISFGQATATLATPTVRSIGCYFGASSANTPGTLVLEVHDGTNYSTVNSSYTPTFNKLFDVVCYSDGAGNVYLYVDGSQVATTANGPKTNGGSTYETVLQIGYKAIGTPTGTSNSVFQSLKFLTN